MFESAIAATSKSQSKLGFPSKRSYCVILVDGLGYENLLARRGHARFLAASAESQRAMYAGFPSTTAANIMSFATGMTVADHGFLGHQVLERKSGVRINLLTGWGDKDAKTWQAKPTLSERSWDLGLPVNVIGPSEYQDSGFTRATMRGAQHLAAESVQERFEIALKVLSERGSSVNYLYVPELDKQAHRTGWLSQEWTAWLELLDQQVERLANRLPIGTGLVLTADHGVIDSPRAQRVEVDSIDPLEELLWFGGDSRASYLYLKDDADSEHLKYRLNQKLNGIAKAYLSDELVAANFFAGDPSEFSSRIPEIVLLAEGSHTLFHSQMSKPRSVEMVAHHGGISAAEMKIPLLIWQK